jgi:hypothetical protein
MALIWRATVALYVVSMFSFLSASPAPITIQLSSITQTRPQRTASCLQRQRLDNMPLLEMWHTGSSQQRACWVESQIARLNASTPPHDGKWLLVRFAAVKHKQTIQAPLRHKGRMVIANLSAIGS